MKILPLTCLKNYFLKDPVLDFLKLYYPRCKDQLKSSPIYLPPERDHSRLLFLQSDQLKASIIHRLKDYDLQYNPRHTYELISRIDETPELILIRPEYKNNRYVCSPDLILGRKASLDITGKEQITLLNIKNIDHTSSENYKRWIKAEMMMNHSILKKMHPTLSFSMTYGIIDKNAKYIDLESENKFLSLKGKSPIFSEGERNSWLRQEREPHRASALGSAKVLSIEEDIEDAEEWNRVLYEEGYKWMLTGMYPPHENLLPNMSQKMDQPWGDIKKELAQRWGELSYLVGLGGNVRSELHSKKIFSYRDPKLLSTLSEIEGIRERDLVEEVIKRIDFPQPIQKLEEEKSEVPILVVDTESLMIPYSKDGKTYKGDIMIGALLINKEGREMKWFINKEEEECKKEYYEWYDSLKEKPEMILHYSPADLRVMSPKMCEICKDVYPLVKSFFIKKKDSPFNGVRNFSLKTISNILFGDMYRDCKIKDGVQAATSLYWSLKKDEDSFLEDVKEYNEVDCKALFQVWKYIERR